MIFTTLKNRYFTRRFRVALIFQNFFFLLLQMSGVVVCGFCLRLWFEKPIVFFQRFCIRKGEGRYELQVAKQHQHNTSNSKVVKPPYEQQKSRSDTLINNEKLFVLRVMHRKRHEMMARRPACRHQNMLLIFQNTFSNLKKIQNQDFLENQDTLIEMMAAFFKKNISLRFFYCIHFFKFIDLRR